MKAFGILLAGLVSGGAVFAAATNHPFAGPVSLVDACNLALAQNHGILKNLKELEATYGVVVQTRATALPKLRWFSDFQSSDPSSVESLPVGGVRAPDHRWSSSLRLVQSIYEGGRITAALRLEKLIWQQALLQHQILIVDTLLNVRVAYDDTLLAAQQIGVQEASLSLIERELEDARKRHAAGAAPRFNVLRAEVELANARPRLIRARNALRIATSQLAVLLGQAAPKGGGEIPLNLSGTLAAEPWPMDLPAAMAGAFDQRMELALLRVTEKIRSEDVVLAESRRRPTVEIFTGYGTRSSSLSRDLTRDISGWFAGVQATWDIYDGNLTRGRVTEANARWQKTRIEIEERLLQIEHEVRVTHSAFVEARELLASQEKVQEQAEEALRLAQARAAAGAATQLDVLSAQTALTEARSTQIQARRDYSVARARLERAVGAGFPAEKNAPH
jgi:outer membrane protein TolC